MGMQFSRGEIVGLVVRGPRDTGIADAIVGLDYVMSGQGNRVQLFNDHDHPLQNLNMRTDARGGFSLCFRWDPTDLGRTLDRPSYRLTVSLPSNQGLDYSRAISQDGELAAVVSLREVASGRLSTFKKPDTAENIVKDLKLILKATGRKFPNMYTAGIKPTGDYYELIGVIKIEV